MGDIETEAWKFCHATLTQFDTEALEVTELMMRMVIDNPQATCENKYRAYATIGKVLIELEERD